jgi:DNA polymerase III subunit delta'
MKWDILGHEWAVELLSQHIANERIRHAYLITGPQGVGRRSLALGMAQALNCKQPVKPGHPCLSCSNCIRIKKMQHPDLTIVQAEQKGGTLKIDQIRELQHGLSLMPYEVRYKVAVLLRFEEAHPSAANALLKTLEEPSSQVILILTAESTESLLPTIVSRCETIRLNPLPLAQVQEGLQQRWNLSEKQAKLLTHISNGRPGYAINLYQNPEQLERRQVWLEDNATLIHSSRTARFLYVETLLKDKDKELPRQALLVWLSFWRDILLRTAGTDIPLTNLDREAEIQELAAKLDLGTARKAVLEVEKTLHLLEGNANTRLALEVLWLNLPRL